MLEYREYLFRQLVLGCALRPTGIREKYFDLVALARNSTVFPLKSGSNFEWLYPVTKSTDTVQYVFGGRRNRVGAFFLSRTCFTQRLPRKFVYDEPPKLLRYFDLEEQRK